MNSSKQDKQQQLQGYIEGLLSQSWALCAHFITPNRKKLFQLRQKSDGACLSVGGRVLSGTAVRRGVTKKMSTRVVRKGKRLVRVRYIQILEGKECEEEQTWRSATNTWRVRDGFIIEWCSKEDCWDNVAMWPAWSEQGFKVRCGLPSLVRILLFLMLQSQHQDPQLELALSVAAWQPHRLAPCFHLPQTTLSVIILSFTSSLRLTDDSFSKALKCFAEISFPFRQLLLPC